MAKLGLTYHDVVIDQGVYDKAISRLTPEQLVRHASP